MLFRLHISFICRVAEQKIKKTTPKEFGVANILIFCSKILSDQVFLPFLTEFILFNLPDFGRLLH